MSQNKCSQTNKQGLDGKDPNITTDQSLKEIDHYMQQYIRYIITSRHYKGNYRISYETLKDWGYCSMVNAYYKKDMY